MRNSRDLTKTLLEILPYVTFGKPSKESISDLILKRGRIADPKQGRILIKSNVIVEKLLGHLGMICVEDITDVLSRVPEGDEEIKTFNSVCDFMNPFDLNKKKIPMKGLQTPFWKRGYWGFRGEKINDFVETVI